MTKDAYEMNENEMRQRIITLGFGGDERLFIAFYKKLQQGLPDGTGIVLRGSVVTNKRHEDDTPFDSQGVGTSDLDVTLVGAKVMGMWDSGAYYIPGLHTKPLCDKDPDIAPALNPMAQSFRHAPAHRARSEPIARVFAEARGTSVEYASHIESRALWPRRSVWRDVLRG